MSAFYQGLANTASRLLKQRGKEYTLSRSNRGDLNPVTGLATTTETIFKLDAVIVPFKSNGSAQAEKLDAQSNVIAEYTMIMATGETTPENGDTVFFSGKTYTLKELTRVSPTEINVIFKANLIA